jgi:hypothetical protein
MVSALEIEPVGLGIALWRAYDPSVKADLYSSAVTTPSGSYLVDPIPLQPEAEARLASETKIAGIILTNENHERAAALFAQKFRAPIYADAALARATQLAGVRSIQEVSLAEEMKPIRIDGGPAGEIAVLFAVGSGTMVVGDALINFEPYGFDLLPAKYCSNFKLMRRSLSKLLDHSFERMLFAHGTPITSHARDRLEVLLNEHR